MPASDWKIRVNQANAEKSTGPRTEAGKERARANALKHGLSGAGIVIPAEEGDAIKSRAEIWRGGFVLDSPTKEWAFDQFVVNTVRIELCQAHQRALGQSEMARAEAAWALDKQLEAALLGDRIDRKPQITTKQLRKTKYGCEWLMSEWCVLGIAAENGPWSDEQLQHALDLAGVRTDARAGAVLEDQARFAEDAYLELEALVDPYLNALDDRDHVNAMSGFPGKLSRSMALLQRYEAVCQKRLDEARVLLEPAKPAVAEAAPTPPAPAPTPQVDPYVAFMENQKAYGEYYKAWEAAPESERPKLAPNFPSTSPAPVSAAPARLSDAVSTSQAPPMNRKQRKAQARRAANAK